LVFGELICFGVHEVEVDDSGLGGELCGNFEHKLVIDELGEHWLGPVSVIIIGGSLGKGLHRVMEGNWGFGNGSNMIGLEGKCKYV
jgi:hypothetical protein